MIVWAPPPVTVTPLTSRSAKTNLVAPFWKSLIDAAAHREGEQAVVLDAERDAALHAADHRLAAGGEAARIGIAHAGDVDVDEAARAVAIEDAEILRRAGRDGQVIDRVAATVAVDLEILDDDVGAVLDRDDGIGVAIVGRGRCIMDVGRRLDGHLADAGDGEAVDAVDLDLLGIGAGR